ncbi:Multiple organellar RNA editing factor 7 mitochondrial [Euphorbia peplus]|nr:Multiple organellar RNA editing factor 7 mitochondrial [Euphorbia peplus]
MLENLVKIPFCLTATLCRRSPAASSLISKALISTTSAADNSPEPPASELIRLPKILEGCDYEHWVVMMEAPKDYPTRDQIINRYVNTLAMALPSEGEAKKSIYSVSTKYYYAFGCNVPEILTYRIKSLPDVKWVLPDSYLCYGENCYRGEPFIDGKVAPYDDKYHKNWLRDGIDGKCMNTNNAKKAGRN